LELLLGDHHHPCESTPQHSPLQQQQQQQQQNEQEQEQEQVALALARRAALTLQRWIRRILQHWRLVRQVQVVVGAHLLPLLEASDALGAGPWAWEWESLCDEGRGLVGHASDVLNGLEMSDMDASATEDRATHPETLLSALLIAAHPEVVTSSCSSKSKRRRLVYERKGWALAQGATRVHETLLALHHYLEQPGISRWIVSWGIRQVKHALRVFTWQREQCQGVAASETGSLAEELTKAVVDVLETVSRSKREMHLKLQLHQQQQQQPTKTVAICERAIREGVAKLGQLDEALQRLVGRPEAERRIEVAKRIVEQRLGLAAEDEKEEENREVDSSTVDSDCIIQQQQQQHVFLTEGGKCAEKNAEQQQQEEELHQHQQQQVVSPTESLYSNEWLVHEMCVLPHGRFLQVSLEANASTAAAKATAALSMSPTTSTCQTESQAGAEAYWASVTRTLLGGDYTPLLVLVQELAERLISTTPSRADLVEEVHGALDVALLGQVLSKDVLDSQLLFSMLRFAGERILWLEAPARNESTKNWLAQLNELEEQVKWQGGRGAVRLSLQGEGANTAWAPLVRPLFEFLLEKVDQIHVDIFNTHVRRATPHCRAHGPLFERQSFEKRLAQGVTSLARARQWLGGVVNSGWTAEQTLRVHDRRYGDHRISLAEGLMQNREDALKEVVRRGYCSLLAEGEASRAMGGFDVGVGGGGLVLHEGVIPETLAMDAHRLDVARHALLCVARTATIVAYLGQAIRRNLGGEERVEVTQGLMVLLPEEAVTEVDIRLHVGHWAESKLGLMDRPARKLLEERVGRMLVEGKCPVLKLLYTRAVDVVHAELRREGRSVTAMRGEETREIKTQCLRQGLMGLEGWIVKVYDLLLLVSRHNEAAFLPLYRVLALEAMAEHQQVQQQVQHLGCDAMMVGE